MGRNQFANWLISASRAADNSPPNMTRQRTGCMMSVLDPTNSSAILPMLVVTAEREVYAVQRISDL